jgi:hypothetical protein
VDLHEALGVAEKDARACELILECGDIDAVLRAYRNTILWLRFWSVRAPQAEWRARFAQELEVRELGLADFRAKALRKGNMKMLGALDAI